MRPDQSMSRCECPAPPEFGDALLDVLQSRDPGKPLHGNSKAARVEHEAQPFGIDLVAFANHTVGGAIVAPRRRA
jgi:hypothetical protein